MDRVEIFERYLLELGRCKHYELKCTKYANQNQEKYEKYLPKFYQHKKMAERYYIQMKEMAIYSDFMEDESIFTDSGFYETDH